MNFTFDLNVPMLLALVPFVAFAWKMSLNVTTELSRIDPLVESHKSCLSHNQRQDVAIMRVETVLNLAPLHVMAE